MLDITTASLAIKKHGESMTTQGSPVSAIMGLKVNAMEVILYQMNGEQEEQVRMPMFLFMKKW